MSTSLLRTLAFCAIAAVTAVFRLHSFGHHSRRCRRRPCQCRFANRRSRYPGGQAQLPRLPVSSRISRLPRLPWLPWRSWLPWLPWLPWLLWAIVGPIMDTGGYWGPMVLSTWTTTTILTYRAITALPGRRQVVPTGTASASGTGAMATPTIAVACGRGARGTLGRYLPDRHGPAAPRPAILLPVR